MTDRRATSPHKVAAIPLVTTHGSSARSATLTEHGATRIPELLRRLRRRGKCAWGSRGQGDGNRRPVVLCRPWGPRPPRPRSPQRPPRLLPASAAFQAGSRCVEVWFCLRMWGSAGAALPGAWGRKGCKPRRERQTVPMSGTEQGAAAPPARHMVALQPALYPGRWAFLHRRSR